MSMRSQFWLAGLTVLVLSAAANAASPAASARLATYENGTGETYFAASLVPEKGSDPQQTNEVVVLFDTSASQAGVFRDDALSALRAMLAKLGPNDRVKLVAIDLKAVEMSKGFVAPNSAEMNDAIAKLQQRAPLGATDLPLALETAAASFTPGKAAHSVVYMGDGNSKANLLTTDRLAEAVNGLVKNRAAVTSYAVGKDCNVNSLAALANQTGGMLRTFGPVDPTLNGLALASAVQAGVLWPVSSTLPESMTAVYPQQVPPLRTDRDTILIGKLANRDAAPIKITAEMNGQPVELTWKVAAERSAEDFAFLPRLVDVARQDRGISLPTVGTAGLREAAINTLQSADQLAKLGQEALASGNTSGALHVAHAALARDPQNPGAIALRDAAKRQAGVAAGAPAGEPDLNLVKLQQPAAPAESPEPLLAEEGTPLIRSFDQLNQVNQQRMQAEVEVQLNEARRVMGQSPADAEEQLKRVLGTIEQSPDLSSEVRQQLRERVEVAIRESRRLSVEVAERLANDQAKIAVGKELERINQELLVGEQRLKQIMDRYTALMEEGRYQIADDEVAIEVDRLDREAAMTRRSAVLAESVTTAGRLQRAYYQISELNRMKRKNFLEAMYQVELSHIPFPDEPPIVYPPAERWEELTLRRKKYASVDLAKQGSKEEKVYKALNDDTTLDFVDTPLKDVIGFLAENHDITIVLTRKIEDAGVQPDQPVTKTLKQVSLRSALRLLLGDLNLTYMVKDEVLKITTVEDAQSPENMSTKVYPVGDLVVPISNNNLLGGILGQGGGFGGQQGGGGGFGGQGGGGFGGQGGGGFGGGGGGLFAVEDDLTIGGKQPAPAAQAKPVAQPAAQQPASDASSNVRRPSRTAGKLITLDDNSTTGWDNYFSSHKESIKKLINSEADSNADAEAAAQAGQLMADARETVRQLMIEKKFDQIATLLQAAIRQGCVEHWMYEGLSLALQANHASPEDLDRALMSAVDFANNEDEVLFIAVYMQKAGLHKRALQLCQQVTAANPSRHEAYVQGLQLAQRLNDAKALEWACVGILSQSWQKDQRQLPESAFRIAKATYENLIAEKRTDEAKKLDEAVRKAGIRDCVVMVSWTGDADIDLSVEEPAGTICSFRQPRSTSGGLFVGDMSSLDTGKTSDGFKEIYVCSQGFDGKYRVNLKNIWGKPTGGKVTIDIFSHFGTPEQKVIHEQIPLVDKNAAVVFELKDGRRQEALPEAQVAQVARVQNAVNQAILAQQMANLNNSPGGAGAAQDFYNSQTMNLALAQRMGFGRGGAVGYRPQITVLPEGAQFLSNAVISADRRYVRVSPSPSFTLVTDVYTFNFVSGSQNQTQGQNGGQGGGFGGGAGGGGGVF